MTKDAPIPNKHTKYFSSYKANDLFWGIGIENETYLEIPNQPGVTGEFLKNNQKRERYSVDYYSGYLPNYFNKALSTIVNNNTTYPIPVLVNAHALTKCDISGEHITNYNKGYTPNVKFNGVTVFDIMKGKSSYIRNEYEKSFCFDGDTLEFMTLDFYKATTGKVVKELIAHKKTFLKELNQLELSPFKGQLLQYPKENYGFARFTTNMKNLAIFNNGTYHFNFTLPTQLDLSGNIANWQNFGVRHKKAIRAIQFLEPFFIAELGSADPLSKSPLYTKRFPAGSQRVAASRYIGAGTYNTYTMETGKLLNEERTILQKRWNDWFWYNKLYSQIHYKKGDRIGFDINFNKFRNHGIELRFFDWFPENQLPEVLAFIVRILDFSEESETVGDPVKSIIWNNIMYKAILYGKTGILEKEEVMYIRKFFDISVRYIPNKNKYTIHDIYCLLAIYFEKKYGWSGACSKYMLEKPTLFQRLSRLFC